MVTIAIFITAILIITTSAIMFINTYAERSMCTSTLSEGEESAQFKELNDQLTDPAQARALY